MAKYHSVVPGYIKLNQTRLASLNQWRERSVTYKRGRKRFCSTNLDLGLTNFRIIPIKINKKIRSNWKCLGLINFLKVKLFFVRWLHHGHNTRNTFSPITIWLFVRYVSFPRKSDLSKSTRSGFWYQNLIELHTPENQFLRVTFFPLQPLQSTLSHR